MDANLVNRIKNIILTPEKEWGVIASESATVPGLYKSYIILLALIGPAAGFIGSAVLGLGTHSVSFMSGLISAAVGYGLNLVAVFLISLVINELAPVFSGTKNQVQALKAITYASTPGWVAGIFGLIPFLGILSLVAGIYGLYLLYLGLPRLMNVPGNKSLIYTIVVIIATIVIMAVAGSITGGLMRF